MLRLDGDRLAVEPIALHEKKRFFNLTLDSSTRVVSRTTSLKDDVETELEDHPEIEDEIAHPSSTRLGQFLEAVACHLETIGEGGFATFRDLKDLRSLAAHSDALGLIACARLLARVVKHLEQQRRGEEVDTGCAAHDLLRAYYLVRLASAQESIAAATALLV